MRRASDTNDGFSTVEMLVAFTVLSLGLGIAVQTVAQSSGSLRRSQSYSEEKLLLRRLIAEELPRLTSPAAPSEISGPNWTVTTSSGEPGVLVSIKIGSETRSNTYLVDIPTPELR